MAEGLTRGEVRLYRFPAPDKQRPVLLLTRGSVLPHVQHVTVAAITSTIRGIPSEVVLDADDGMKSRCAINLHLIQTVPRHGIGKLVAVLRPARMAEVRAALLFALGFDT
jgi:mRNA interferase MazF